MMERLECFQIQVLPATPTPAMPHNVINLCNSPPRSAPHKPSALQSAFEPHVLHLMMMMMTIKEKKEERGGGGAGGGGVHAAAGRVPSAGRAQLPAAFVVL